MILRSRGLLVPYELNLCFLCKNLQDGQDIQDGFNVFILLILYILFGFGLSELGRCKEFKIMDKDNRSLLIIFLIWLGLIILSAVTGHFNVPDELKSSWDHFTVATPGEKTAGIVLFVFLAILVSLVSFSIGVILLPLEILIFPILALATLNGFWLTMFIVWKYVLLFTFVF